jgi:AcrR family transcriptional regulator
LIHYHFQDKDSLLVQLVEWITDGLVRREMLALATSTPQSAIDDLWRWLESELTRGHVRALVELSWWPSERVRTGAVAARERRRVAATSTAERLFRLLALTPRVPTTLLGDLLVSFVDGLASAPDRVTGERARAAFDVLWLALLGLAD